VGYRASATVFVLAVALQIGPGLNISGCTIPGMQYSRTLLVLCLSIPASLLAQQNKKLGQADTMQILQQWATLQAAWGVPTAEPVPGSSLELVEKERDKSPEGYTIIHYNFKVKGLPLNATYYMGYWPVGAPSYPFQRIANGVRINNDGLVVCSPKMACGDKTKPEFPLEIAIPRTAKGETHRFVLTSEKNAKVLVTGLATPFPVTATSGSCQLEFVRVTPNGEMFLLRGTGFPANRDITISGDSAGEEHSSTTHTDASGIFQTAELPFVIGKTSGILEDAVTAGADCHPSLSAKWGDGSRELQ
jgi:hypothetical protein